MVSVWSHGVSLSSAVRYWGSIFRSRLRPSAGFWSAVPMRPPLATPAALPTHQSRLLVSVSNHVLFGFPLVLPEPKRAPRRKAGVRVGLPWYSALRNHRPADELLKTVLSCVWPSFWLCFRRRAGRPAAWCCREGISGLFSYFNFLVTLCLLTRATVYPFAIQVDTVSINQWKILGEMEKHTF